MKKYCLPILIIGMVNWGYSQDVHQNIVPPSPNATGFAKYVDTPVSYYTGIPNISIPIYEITAKGFSLPINLSYHAGGIKVSQEASWVGLGWSLNAGGVITRTIKGVDDFSRIGRTGYPFAEHPGVVNDGSNNMDIAQYTNSSNSSDELDAMENGYLDSEPDIFYFNFGGFSGRFFFDKCIGCGANDLVPVLQDQGNLNIVYDQAGHWTITDVQGNRYLFGTKEYTEPRSMTSDHEIGYNVVPPSNIESVTTWYLDEIVTNKGESIIFGYDYGPYKSQSQLHRTEKISHLVDLNAAPGNCPGSHPGCSASGGHGTMTGRYEIHSGTLTLTEDVYLESITFPNGHIDFTKSARLDVKRFDPGAFDYDPPQKLDRIKIFSNGYTGPIRTLVFNTDYFKRSPLDNDPLYLRLKLDSLTIKDKDNVNDLPPYVFSYNENGVPSKLTKDIDHWGYFNGAGNNGTMIPPSGYKDDYYPGADRTVDTDNAKVFSLTGIQFPSGGSHTFNYGSNEYYDTSNGTIETEQVSKHLFSPVYACIYEPNGFCDYNEPHTTTEIEVTQEMIDKSPLQDDIVVDLRLTVSGFDIDCGGIAFPNAHTVMAFLRKIDGPGGQVMNMVKQINYPDPNNAEFHCTNGLGEYHYSSDHDGRYQPNLRETTLSKGWYRLEIFSAHPGMEVYAEGRFLQDEMLNTVPNFKGPGLRIQSIVLDDGMAGTPNIVKNYQYLLDDNESSSGLLMNRPSYFKTDEVFGKIVHRVGQACVLTCPYSGIYFEGNSHSIFPLSTSAGGNYVGYSVVTETISGGDNGHKKYYFQNKEDMVDAFGLPGLPTKPHLNNGLMTDVITYNASGTRERSEHYNYIIGASAPSIGALSIHTSLFDDGFNGPLRLYRFYELESMWYKLDNKEIIQYDDNDTPEITERFDYGYNVDNKLTSSVREAIMESGIERTRETTYQYPTDFPSNSTEYGTNLLRSNYMIGKVVVERQQYDNTDIYKKETYYGSSGNEIVPYQIDETFKGEPSSTIGRAFKYDHEKNIVEVRREAAPTVSYIWGYDKQYPIAKIENADYEKIRLALGFASESEVKSLNESNMAQINGLRNHLDMTDALVTTYAYDPLVGVTSMTDPRGYTTYYEYDAFNRLQSIKDANHNLVTDYGYHYKN